LRLQQIDQMETLARILASRSAHQLIYGNLAKEIRVAVDTVRRWIEVLRNLHLGFLIRPWFHNVSRSLRKEPKWFLRDWSSIEDLGDRAETFVACHLLKAVEGWNDMGLGKFELGYLRDKQKHEVDFLVARDESIRGALEYYQQQIKAPRAFQIIVDADYVDADCFVAVSAVVARTGLPTVARSA
jgi:predicted AAA+ superfamily ATPase